MIFPRALDTYSVPSPSEHIQYLKRHEWRTFMGRRGKVYSVTTVYEPPAGFESLSPYDQMLVQFPDGTMRTFMGAYGEHFQIGEEVECFVGAFPTDSRSIIPYRIKVRHPVSAQPLAPLKMQSA